MIREITKKHENELKNRLFLMAKRTKNKHFKPKNNLTNTAFQKMLNEVANIYDGLLKIIEIGNYETSMKEYIQYITKIGKKINDPVIFPRDQCEAIRYFRYILTNLDKEISKLESVELHIITNINENRGRAINALQSIIKLAKMANNSIEKKNFNSFGEEARLAINLALSILKFNKECLNDSAFQDISKEEIINEI
jgi:formyltetrahydrofolate synthetase